MRLRVIVLLSAIVVLVLIAFYLRPHEDLAYNLTGDKKLIAEAVAYALDNEKKMDWEEYHVLKMIDRYYPMQKIDDAVENAYKNLYSGTDIIREAYRTVARLHSTYLLIHTKYDPNFLRMLNKNHSLSGGIYSLDCVTETDYYCLLLNAIYCDYYPLNRNYTNSLNKLRDDGYEGTSRHLFIVLQLKELGCFNNSTLNPLIAEDVQVLGEREDNETKNQSVFNPSVYIERAAYINLSGYPLKEEWVETIRRTLDGQMKDNNRIYSIRHTLLEALVLAQQLAARNESDRITG